MAGTGTEEMGAGGQCPTPSPNITFENVATFPPTLQHHGCIHDFHPFWGFSPLSENGLAPNFKTILLQWFTSVALVTCKGQ